MQIRQLYCCLCFEPFVAINSDHLRIEKLICQLLGSTSLLVLWPGSRRALSEVFFFPRMRSLPRNGHSLEKARGKFPNGHSLEIVEEIDADAEAVKQEERKEGEGAIGRTRLHVHGSVNR